MADTTWENVWFRSWKDSKFHLVEVGPHALCWEIVVPTEVDTDPSIADRCTKCSEEMAVRREAR